MLIERAKKQLDPISSERGLTSLSRKDGADPSSPAGSAIRTGLTFPIGTSSRMEGLNRPPSTDAVRSTVPTELRSSQQRGRSPS